MVAEYIAKYGGTSSGVNADVAEAYSVGQVAAQAVKATGGIDNAKIISYLHSGVTLTSVQGPVHFNSLGENESATAFVFQWQKATFVQDAAGRQRIFGYRVPETKLGPVSEQVHGELRDSASAQGSHCR